MKTTLRLLPLLCLFTASAQTTFQKTYGSTTADYAMFIEQTFDGGYAFAGTGNGLGPSGSGNVYLVKLNANGDTVWTRVLGTASAEQVLEGHQTADSGYILCGAYGSGPFQSFMMKADKNGNLVWEKRYSTSSNTPAQAVRQTPDGGFILVGTTASGPVAGCFVVRTNSLGDTLWTRRCTYNNITLGGAFSVQNTSDGGFILGGYTYELMNGPGYDMLLVKLNAAGTVMWMKMFGGVNHEYGSNVVQTFDGGYALTGYTMSFGAGLNDMLVIKTDSAGTLQWARTYGSSSDDLAQRIRQTPDGGFIISGYTLGFGGPDGDLYLVKTDASGNHQWSKRYGQSSITEECYGLDVTSDGGYILAGRGGPIYVVKTDASGSSGCNEANTATIVTTPTVNVFTPVPQVSRGCTVTNLSPAMTNPSCTVTTLCSVTVQSEVNQNKFDVTVMPNPSNGTFLITSTEKMELLELYSSLGVMIGSFSGRMEKELGLDLTAQAPGIYFVRITYTGGALVKTIIRQ